MPHLQCLCIDGTKPEVIAAILQAGLRVTVNSDDPAYFLGYINENLIRPQEEVDLGKAGIFQLVTAQGKKQNENYLT